MRIVWTGMILGLLGTGLGCQNKVYEENKQLRAQSQEQQRLLEEERNRARNAPDPGMVSSLQSEVAARDARIRELEEQLKKPTPGAPAQPGIEGIETSFDQRSGNLTVAVPGDVLFDSGRTTLKESAKATLNKVVGAIKRDYAGKQVFVDGHTDSDPINKTKDKYEDNLDLSAARARTVAQYLISQGVDQKNVGMRAFGPTAPKANKSSSRRVEIVVATR